METVRDNFRRYHLDVTAPQMSIERIQQRFRRQGFKLPNKQHFTNHAGTNVLVDTGAFVCRQRRSRFK